jgi:hypothetical protein
MPYLLNMISERPDEAIDEARKDCVQRAKDIWGLEYADYSDGLYPSGNQIGRTMFRPDHTHARPGNQNVALLNTNGGQWRTFVSLAGGAGAAMVTDANGWGDYFDFILSSDMFLILEGLFSIDTAPTVREHKYELSSTALPVIQNEEIYSSEQEVKGYYEVDAVVSPDSQCRMRIRSSTVGGNITEAFGPIGECVGKRQILVREIY